jgi:hypothetical protein
VYVYKSGDSVVIFVYWPKFLFYNFEGTPSDNEISGGYLSLVVLNNGSSAMCLAMRLWRFGAFRISCFVLFDAPIPLFFHVDGAAVKAGIPCWSRDRFPFCVYFSNFLTVAL